MSIEENQRQLASLWKTARAGTLSPWSQAKAWAVLEQICIDMRVADVS